MIELATFIAFAATFVVAWIVLRAIVRLRRDPIRARLAAAGEPGGTGMLFGEQWTRSLAGQIPETTLEKGELDRDLRRAGYYRGTAKQEFLALRNAVVILVVILAGVLAVAVGPERQNVVIQIVGFGVMAAGICWALPRVVVGVQAKRRLERIRRALPDALDMISLCVEGGLPLHNALAHAGRELFATHRDLAIELLIVRQQAEMNSLDFAFGQLAQRIDVPETLSLATLIHQNQRLGTNVATSVRSYADSMRLQRRQSADERTGKVQIKSLFPVAFCLVPSVLILLWGPAALELWRFFQEMAETTPGM